LREIEVLGQACGNLSQLESEPDIADGTLN
jgi:hypothetical protein